MTTKTYPRKLCRKCKGHRVVPDLTWCGKDCCPREIDCLFCARTGLDPKLPRGWRLDPDVEQVMAHIGVWWVITPENRRTAWNQDWEKEKVMICPVCKADPEKQPDCADCAGRGRVDSVPYCERPWDEVTARVEGGHLYVGGHHCQFSGAEGGNAVVTDEFDLVVSLFNGGPEYGPSEGVEHIRYRMADADLDPEHHTGIDDLAERVVDAFVNGKRVLVRCQAGINRSALVAGLALLKLGWTADEAISKMREVRSPYVLFNESFVAHLRDVEAATTQGERS